MRQDEIVAGHFRIVNEAGVGGMGTVYRAIDERGGGLVALKVLHGGGVMEAARFDREAGLLAALSHPRIVRYLAHGALTSGERYLVMELLEGETLAARIVRDSMTVADCVRLGLHVAEALGAVHDLGIVHRDVKPANLFLEGGSIDQLKLLDFGIARRRASTNEVDLTAAGIVVGTPRYMAPEQFRGDRDIDARADVYALGSVLFRCLTGRAIHAGMASHDGSRVPFDEEAPRVRSLCGDVPEPLEDLVARMVARSPGERPADARQVADELGAVGHALAIDVGGALTRAEQRVRVVLVARLAQHTDVDATMRQSDLVDRNEQLRAIVRAGGAEAEVFVDRSLVITPTRPGGPAEHAILLARCAATLRTWAPEMSIALVGGRGVPLGRLPVRGVLDRGAGLLALVDAAPRILVDEITAGLLRQRFEIARDDAGMSLGAERDDARAPLLLGKATPCLGRDRELGILESAFEECAGDRVATAVVVTGPPGSGKSRLRWEFVQRLERRAEPFEVWDARAEPMGIGAPFGMISRTIRRAVGIVAGEPVEAQRARIEARVGRVLSRPSAPRIAQFLGEIAGLPFPDERCVELRAARADPVLMGDQIRRAWAEWIVAECRDQAIVLILEDLHWGDLPTVKLVDAALVAAAEAPLFVLALARPEVATVFPDLWVDRGRTALPLRPLTRRASEQLARSVLGPDAADALVENVVERAGGNALFLEECLRATAAGQAERLPLNVAGILEDRLQALGPEQRRVLRAASVFGKTFWLDGVEALTQGLAGMARLFDALIDKEILARHTESRFAGGVEYHFRHVLVREAAYAMLTDEDRVLGHRLAGEWLERMGERDALTIAEHFELAGEAGRAVPFHLRAAQEALSGGDFVEAIARAERGVAAGPHGETLGHLLLAQAEAFEWRGEHAREARAGEAALAVLPEGGSAWYAAGTFHILGVLRQANYEGVAPALARLRRPVPRPEALAAAAAAKANLSAFVRPTLGAAHADALLDEADAHAAGLGAPEPMVEGRIHWARAFRARLEGDLGACHEGSLLAIERYEAAGNRRAAAYARINTGLGLVQLGAYEEACTVLREGLAVSERLGLPLVVAWAKNNLGPALLGMGQIAEARACEEEAIAFFQACGNERMEGSSRTYLAQILAAQSDASGALREVELAITALGKVPLLRAKAEAVLAALLLSRGQFDAALAAARAAMVPLRAGERVEAGEALIRLIHADALAAAGELDGARAAHAEARAALLARGARIRADRHRQSFLDRVPENARTLTEVKLATTPA
jgi:tetratricopeptide (TPR) repeat protein